MTKTPAEIVIEKFGGPVEVARILKIDPTNVYRWNYPRKKSGNNGLVRGRYQKPLLDYARKHGIDLKPADFFDGA